MKIAEEQTEGEGVVEAEMQVRRRVRFGAGGRGQTQRQQQCQSRYHHHHLQEAGFDRARLTDQQGIRSEDQSEQGVTQRFAAQELGQDIAARDDLAGQHHQPGEKEHGADQQADVVAEHPGDDVADGVALHPPDRIEKGVGEDHQENRAGPGPPEGVQVVLIGVTGQAEHRGRAKRQRHQRHADTETARPPVVDHETVQAGAAMPKPVMEADAEQQGDVENQPDHARASDGGWGGSAALSAGRAGFQRG